MTVYPVADSTLCEPVGRNRSEREHIASLDRIEAFYERRLASNPPPGLTNWLRAEVAALRWARRRIAEAEHLERDGAA